MRIRHRSAAPCSLAHPCGLGSAVRASTREMIRRATVASSPSSSRRAERAKTTLYSATPAPAPEHTPLHGLQPLAGLRGSLLGQGPVVKVFPEPRLPLQIDLDGGLTASAIDEKPNSSNHALSSLSTPRRSGSAAGPRSGPSLQPVVRWPFVSSTANPDSWARLGPPRFRPQRQLVQVCPGLAPCRVVLAKQHEELLAVSGRCQMNHFVDDHILAQVLRFFHEFGIQANVLRPVIATGPFCLHPLEEIAGHLDA